MSCPIPGPITLALSWPFHVHLCHYGSTTHMRLLVCVIPHVIPHVAHAPYHGPLCALSVLCACVAIPALPVCGDAPWSYFHVIAHCSMQTQLPISPNGVGISPCGAGNTPFPPTFWDRVSMEFWNCHISPHVIPHVAPHPPWNGPWQAILGRIPHGMAHGMAHSDPWGISWGRTWVILQSDAVWCLKCCHCSGSIVGHLRQWGMSGAMWLRCPMFRAMSFPLRRLLSNPSQSQSQDLHMAGRSWEAVSESRCD